MSTLVKRCATCRDVRGMTAFPVRRGKGRDEVCRWCQERARNEARTIRELRTKVRRLVHQEGVLLAEVSRVRAKLAKARWHLAACEGQRPTLAVGELVERAS